MATNINETIIANLQVLLQEAQSSKETNDHFRARAYRNAIAAIKKAEQPIRSGKEAQQLEGVGKKIADKIQEIIDTGRLHQVEDLGTTQLEKTKALTKFANIWGVGPVKAQELWDNGARSIKDIKKHYKDLLNDNQKIGLKYYFDLQKRIPREEVTVIAKKISQELRTMQKELGWKIKHRVCGSYRRKAKTCGDMDVLLTERDNQPVLTELVKRLTDSGILIETLGIGPTKYLGITKTSVGSPSRASGSLRRLRGSISGTEGSLRGVVGTGRPHRNPTMAFRIDMEVIKPEEWPFAMLYFTGSGPFNERQRLIAKKQGYSLSEHGLKNVSTGEYITGITSEREIFEFLGMTYLPPDERR